MKVALPLLLASGASAFSVSRTFAPQTSKVAPLSTSLNMFGGSGDAGEELGEEEEAKIEAAAKAMGFSVAEYKLVLRMQKQLSDSVNTMRCSAGSDVKVTIDGNSPPNFLEIEVSESAKSGGASAVETGLIAAYKEAAAESKKGQQEAVKKMNQDIADEMKKMGVA